ncbi:unnamed protein product [Linum tenue]|uniref:Late embryogenesis abundant protein LEA-2 subgroup domain-containing protein n=1 Tax=Linum tenue TaxID=586396 RepID=A0AAV0K5P1_9ROSI|nr:unnamed protein product [Linum tenue]
MAGMFFLILLFTAFRIKDPHVAVAGLTTTNGTAAVGNATVLADVKVRNPNAAAFRFGHGEATIYYGDTVVGEAATPPGRVKAGGTVHMSVAVEISGEKLSGVPQLREAVESGTLMMSCVTRIPGDVKIITKKHMVVKAICAVNYDYATGQVTAGRCAQYIIS